jgi:hypothetical protein
MNTKVTPEDIDNTITNVEYAVFGGRLTVCVLTLRNGFLVTGESSCVSAENFDAELGKAIARENAVNKIWQLEGYVLRNKLFN